MDGDDGVTVFFEDFFELDGACVPDVDRVILRPNRDVLTVGGEGGASPVAARLKPLRTKCRTNLIHPQVDHLHGIISTAGEQVDLVRVQI